MTAVVGIDLSLTKTGVATITGESRTVTPDGRTGMERISWVTHIVLGYCPLAGLVAIEGYAFRAHDSHAHELGELGGVLRYRLWTEGIAFMDVPPAIVKGYACGKGNASKDEVLVAAVKRLGYEGASKDEADALWIRAAVLDRLGEPVIEVPQDHQKHVGKLVIPTAVA